MGVARTALLCTAALLALSGCESVSGGARPVTLAQLGLPDLYSGDDAARPPHGAEDLTRWWRRFDDPLLDALVERESEAGPVASNKAGYRQAVERIAAAAAIARRYVALRARQAKIANIRADLAARQEDEEIARFRAEAKLVTPLDALQAVAERDRVAAAIPALEAEIAADIAHIAALTGQAPAALREPLSRPAPIPVGPAEVAAGAPSDLLTRRPEARLARARSSTPAAYKEMVLRMIEEAENARASFAFAKAREAALDKAVAAAEQLAALARKQYREGTSDHVALQNAERALLAVRNERVDAAAARATALIDLFTALGGSWEAEADGRRP